MICALKALRSKKAMAASVTLLLGALIPPVTGNMIIIITSRWRLAVFGYYVYFLGMNLVMFALLRFAMDYCEIRQFRWMRILVSIFLLADSVQLLLNLIFHHAFGTEAVLVEGRYYHRLLPRLGQTIHRLLDYSILAAVLFIFLVVLIRSPRIHWEKYLIILLTIVLTAVWETAYIFSRAPVDRSMIGFGVFGVLVFYFSLYYRPLRLLDSMLANMASELPEGLFFFDSSRNCIWANRLGMELTRVGHGDYEKIPDRLKELFGDYVQSGKDQYQIRSGRKTKSYVLENHMLKDDRGRLIGSFLSVRDNTVDQIRLQKEVYKATHDSLTGMYNRAGYDMLLSGMDINTTYMLLIDVDSFKDVNDTYGHETGDQVLKKVAETIRRHFRSDDSACRIGGDEFVVFIMHAGEAQKLMIISRVNQINAELAKTSDGLPPLSISAGIAHGSEATDAAEWFEHADQALYETKRKGRKGYTFYTEKPAS